MSIGLPLILLPFATAFIGWLTNWVAIKMLFKPRTAKNLLGFTWQGLIPKRQKDLSDEVSEIIEREFLQQDLLKQSLLSLDLPSIMSESVQKMVRVNMAEKLRSMPMVGAFINDATLGMLESMVMKEIQDESGTVLEKISAKMEKEFAIRELIRDRIEAFDLDKLEDIVMSVSKKEFRTIEIVGACLGFAIGLTQVFFILYSSGELQKLEIF